MQGLRQGDQYGLGFTGDDRVGDPCAAVTGLQQVTAIEPGVQSEKAQMGAGICGPGFVSSVDPDSQGGMHGDGNGNQVCSSRLGCWEIFDGQVGCCCVEAGGAQGGQRPSQAERLVTEFVAGDE